MGHLYIVAQGPGKALKFIANLNELVDGDNIATEHCPEEGPTDKGRIASDEVGRLVAEMEKEEVLALLGSVGSLHYITKRLEETLQEYVGVRWGPSVIEWLRE